MNTALTHTSPDHALTDLERVRLATQGRGLTRTYRGAQIILLVQAAVLLLLSTFQWWRFALTYDFVVYFHAWHGFWANGLNPFNASVDHLVLANNGVFITWPLAVLTRIYPHGVVLLWIQDLAVVAAEFLVASWMFDALSRSRIATEQARLAMGIFGTGFLCLVLNPWVYWSTAFDFHSESVAVLFLVLAARALADRRWRWLVIWTFGVLLCGYVTATYVIGLVITALILGGERRRVGLTTLLIMALLVPVIGFDPSLNRALTVQINRFYGYLANRPDGFSSAFGALGGFFVHFPRIVQTIWDRSVDLWANVAPGGLIGLISPLVLGMAILLLPENLLNSNTTLVAPSFQYLPLYVLLPPGTVFVLLRLADRGIHLPARGRALVGWLTFALAANACGWAIVWFPHFASSWLRVDPGAAAILAHVKKEIPPGDEVVASQGIAGRFADRQWIEPITGPGVVPAYGSRIWFVLAPAQGLETEQVGAGFATIGMLAGPMRAQLVDSANGIWVFDWNRPSAIHSINLPGVTTQLPGWVTAGPAGVAITNGPVNTWRLVSSGKPGYVLAYDYWKEPVGAYTASITLSASGPINVEVWNANSDTLLARRELPQAESRTSLSIPVDNPKSFSTSPFTGEGPFQMTPPEAGVGDQLEVRVWSPGATTVQVNSVGLRPSVVSKKTGD